MSEEQGVSPEEGLARDFLRTYCALMDHVLPTLTPAEHVVFQRLLRLSYVQQKPQARCRYETLALQCGISLRTLQRALRSLKQKQLVKTLWQSHGATTFTVNVTFPAASSDNSFPSGESMPSPSPLSSRRVTPPVYDAFSDEDRELFLTGKRSLSPIRLNQLTEAAVEWLTERSGGNPNRFSDQLLRDKVDELVSREIFGPERQGRYSHLFGHLYRLTTDIRKTV